MKTRTALQVALFETWNDLRWYIQRKGNTNAKALAEAVKVWIKMLTPFAPYMCEELWSQTGETGFISTAQWPKFDEAKLDLAAEEQENLITDILTDTQNILKATKITPKRLVFYTCGSVEMANLPKSPRKSNRWRRKNQRTHERIRRHPRT